MVASCPSCGYDQSGVMESWEGSCPLRGVCSECGTGFEWREAVRMSVRIPWLFEDARWGAWAVLRTWLRVLYPPGFWSRVAGHRVRVGRLMLWLLLMLVSVYLARGLLYTAVSWWTYHRHPAMVSNWQYLPWYGYAWTWPFFGFVVGWGWWPVRWSVPHWPNFVWMTGVASLVWTMAMLALGGGRRREAVRAWAYSHAWLGVLGLIAVADLIVSLVMMAAGCSTGGSGTTGFYYHRTFGGYWLLRALPWAPVVVLVCWQGWWWWCAIGRERRWVWWLGLVLILGGAGAVLWRSGLAQHVVAEAHAW